MEKNINKTYTIFDDTYMGPGYFIITENNNEIIRFVKFYQMDKSSFPRYGVRAYEKDSIDEPDQVFRDIEFEFNKEDDLFEPILNLASKTKEAKLSSIDISEHGKNNFNASIHDKKVKLTFSKDVYGVKNATDFINIVLGDNYTCIKYLELCSFLCDLGNISIKSYDKIDIQKLLKI